MTDFVTPPISDGRTGTPLPVRPPKQTRPWMQPRCPYCGRKIRDGCDACSAHDDLPFIDPLAALGKS